METFAIPFLLFVGTLLTLQAAANVQLSTALASPYGASTLQLTIGAVLLLVLTAIVGTLGAFDRISDATAWHLVGGLGSSLYITAGILLFPRLGAVVAVGLFIAGQMGASLLLDGFGWIGVEERALGIAAALGAFAVIAGTWLIVRAQTSAGAAPAAPQAGGRPGWIVLGLLAGAVLPIQGAINAQLRADLDAPITAAAFSFVVAALAMAIALVVLLALRRTPPPQPAGLQRVPWWGWLGGACGATYVTAVFTLIPEIGVAATVALTVAGQQAASVVVDRRGLLRLPQRPVGPRRLAGVGLLLAGVALIQLA